MTILREDCSMYKMCKMRVPSDSSTSREHAHSNNLHSMICSYLLGKMLDYVVQVITNSWIFTNCSDHVECVYQQPPSSAILDRRTRKCMKTTSEWSVTGHPGLLSASAVPLSPSYISWRRKFHRLDIEIWRISGYLHWKPQIQVDLFANNLIAFGRIVGAA